MNGIPSGPLLGRIEHYSEVTGGRSFVANFAENGKAITIHHKNGNSGKNAKVDMEFSSVVEFAVPTICGRAICCYTEGGSELLMNTLTGQPWKGKWRLRFVI